MFNVVSTPIGNLKDITLRALETLKNSDVILCEDTRHSLVLLDKYDIKAKLISYHKFNEEKRVEYVISLLEEGKEVSLITDAGTPIISDPGYVIIKALKERNIPYTSVPGACAFVNAIALSGIDCSQFTFFGFLPDGKKRKEKLEKVKNTDGVLIFYVSPHSVDKDVEDLYKVLGKRSGVIVREMTKLHEEVLPITLTDNFDQEIIGEMVLILEGEEKKVNLESLTPMEHLMGYINSGMDKNDAIKLVAKERKVPKNEIYKLLNND